MTLTFAVGCIYDISLDTGLGCMYILVITSSTHVTEEDMDLLKKKSVKRYPGGRKVDPIF